MNESEEKVQPVQQMQTYTYEAARPADGSVHAVVLTSAQLGDLGHLGLQIHNFGAIPPKQTEIPSTILKLSPSIHAKNGNSVGGIGSPIRQTKKKNIRIKPKPENFVEKKSLTIKRSSLNTSKPEAIKKFSTQPDAPLASNQRDGTNHQTVYVLQSGNQYPSVESHHENNLKTIINPTDNLITSNISKNNISTSDQPSKTRIIYRVLKPEDLDLCTPNEPRDTESLQPLRKLAPKKAKLKPSSQTDSPKKQVISVTRSGRCVRPPRHIALNYEQNTNIDMETLDAEINKEALIKNLDNPSDKLPVRCRVACPFCQKAYHSSKSMARHFNTFPNHAINPKCLDLLNKYKAEIEMKKNQTSDAETQTDYEPLPNFSNNMTPIHMKKDAETDASFHKYHRDDKSLFRGFMRILRSTSPECRATVFVRQLALLVVKLRKLLPCLLSRTDNASTCLINEPIGKVLDIAPGKYNLDMDAIACSKIPSGMCIHSQNVQPIICNETPNTFSDSWLNDSKRKEENVTECARTTPDEKWTSNASKRKWIPIGEAVPDSDDMNESSISNRENWISTTELLSNSTFTSSDKAMENWKPNVTPPVCNKTAKSESWISDNMTELSKIDISRELEPENHLIDTNQRGVLNESLHGSLVFDMEKEILPIDMKASLDCNNEIQSTSNAENFDFNDSSFDMPIEKLNFTNAQYNEMKFTEDPLPAYTEIEAAKNIQLPVKALNTVDSESVKSGDPILANDGYPIASESLDLNIEQSHQIESIRKSGLHPENVDIHSRELLEAVDLNLPIDGSNSMNVGGSILNVNESSMDESNLSSSQSVLNLLDPLGADCLSFSDNDLNNRTSQMALDLQLDLFQFHHS